MARRPVNVLDSSFSTSITYSFMDDLVKYNKPDHLYYAVNNYDDESRIITIYGFEIIKTTECFFFIKGRRIHKEGINPFAKTPEQAVRKSIKRARNYIDILARRGRSVISFIEKYDSSYSDNVYELQLFNELAKRADNVDNLPADVFNRNLTKIFRDPAEW